MKVTTIKPAVPSDSRAAKQGVRLTVVEDLGGGLYLTRLSARFARLAWVRWHTGLGPGIYQLTTHHGVRVAVSADRSKLVMLAVALSESQAWSAIAAETDPERLAKLARESSPPDERKMLVALASACEDTDAPSC